MSQYVESKSQQEIDQEAHQAMKNMYARKDYATVQHKWTARGVFPSCDRIPVEAENTLFDVEEQWDKMSPERKSVVRDNIASGACHYHKEVVKYMHTFPLAEDSKTIHEREADHYLQTVVQLFADEGKSEADQNAMKDAVKLLENAITVLSPKSKFLAARNLSCYLNEKAQDMEFAEAARNRTLFESNDVIDAQIKEQKEKLDELLTEIKVDLKRYQRMDGEPAKKKQRASKQVELSDTKGNILSLVEEINRLYHKRKLMGVVRQANYDANEAAFYTFRNGDEIDIFELFREQATHAEYNLTKFKADKHCTEAKGFGRNRFENRKEALNASIRSLKADLAADKYQHYILLFIFTAQKILKHMRVKTNTFIFRHVWIMF